MCNEYITKAWRTMLNYAQKSATPDATNIESGKVNIDTASLAD